MIITIANQKGGVGKTTSTVNIAAGLAMKGYRTLLIDTDPQCNSTSLFFNPKETEQSLFLAFSNNDIDTQELIKKTDVERLYAIPANIHLAKVERMLAGEIDAPIKLKKALKETSKNFDFIMIDSPPSLGLLTVNALVASDYVIIPIAPSPWALVGVEDFLDTFKGVKETFNENLKILGVLITLFDSRTTLAKDAASKIREMFGELVFEEVIHRNIRLEESPAFKENIFTFAPDSKGAFSYNRIT
ncbi:MAG: ParA family protein, partial [Caldisericaceae bacterium]